MLCNAEGFPESPVYQPQQSSARELGPCAGCRSGAMGAVARLACFAAAANEKKSQDPDARSHCVVRTHVYDVSHAIGTTIPLSRLERPRQC